MTEDLSISASTFLSMAFAFWKIALPDAPKFVGSYGLAATLTMLIAELVMPSKKIQITSGIAFIAGVILIGYAINNYISQPRSKESGESPGNETNMSGHIINNSGIATQGQVGNNEIK